MSKLLDFGQQATGVVADERDWGGRNPAIVRPRRVVTGEVHRIFSGAPNVVGVTTPTGEQLVIRTELR